MVPASTLMYGSIFCRVTRKPRASRREPMDAAASPLPSEDTTPPVTKMNLVVTSRLLSRCEPFFHDCALLGQGAGAAVQTKSPQPAERLADARTARDPHRQQVSAREPRAHRAPARQVPLHAPATARPRPKPSVEQGRFGDRAQQLVDRARA